jgi:hypothetical protein
MKKIIITLIMSFALVFSSVAQTPLVYDEKLIQNGAVFVRIINDSPYTIGCSLEDEFTFHTYVIYANTIGMWHRVYGKFEWYCE